MWSMSCVAGADSSGQCASLVLLMQSNNLLQAAARELLGPNIHSRLLWDTESRHCFKTDISMYWFQRNQSCHAVNSVGLNDTGVLSLFNKYVVCCQTLLTQEGCFNVFSCVNISEGFSVIVSCSQILTPSVAGCFVCSLGGSPAEAVWIMRQSFLGDEWAFIDVAVVFKRN